MLMILGLTLLTACAAGPAQKPNIVWFLTVSWVTIEPGHHSELGGDIVWFLTVSWVAV